MLHESAAEFHVCELDPNPADFDRLVDSLRPYLGKRVLDVGCGEGHLLAALQRHGFVAEGVDLTPELVSRAAAQGVQVTEGDALAFIRNQGSRFDTFLMMDFVEHIPFDAVVGLLDALPAPSRCVIQTPNTNSIIGHQFYLQVPSHVNPLSPAVLKKMLSRAGMVRIADGTLHGGLPWTGLRRRLTRFLLTKVFGTSLLPLLVEGANYYVVADKPSKSPRESGRLPAT
jgi:SAM-dependent methyltransferase